MGTLLSLLLGLMVGSVVLHVSAKVVGGEGSRQASFGTAVGANLVMLVGGALLGAIPVIGVLLSIALWIIVVMKAYDMGVLRALVVGLVYLFIVGGLFFVLATFFGVALFSLAGVLALFA